ncbi:MAG TPA: amphi-Trp domain-containing protein [Planctomycetota bacterium]|nr:amphi-Trp domain-containing protein [Planctomycetota bacterium]
MTNDDPTLAVEAETANEEEKKASKKVEVEFENSMSREEAVSYFEAIVAGLKKGRLHIKQGDQSLDLEPGQQVDVEVQASRKKGRERICFEIAWREVRESNLSISSD